MIPDTIQRNVNLDCHYWIFPIEFYDEACDITEGQSSLSKYYIGLCHVMCLVKCHQPKARSHLKQDNQIFHAWVVCPKSDYTYEINMTSILHKAANWLKSRQNIQVGDVVLIQGETCPCGCWPLELGGHQSGQGGHGAQCENPYQIFYLAATKQLYDWFSPSVCLSVRPSVRHTFFTMFPSSYHHEIFRSSYQWQKWLPCKRSRSEVKGQGHRGQHPT